MVGRRIGPFEITDIIGSGGMGEVYKARDVRLERVVAIKAIRSERRSDSHTHHRFIREARAASGLNHPNIVTIHDVIELDGATFLVMEYVNGHPLDELTGSKGLRLRDALNYAAQIADALAAAHAAGIVHRDIKPANIIVSNQGRVKVLDFGLAKPAYSESVTSDQTTRTTEFRTEEGTIVGSVAYMSPEQAEAKQVDARSDIFSFGAVFFEMLTGRRAFEGSSRASVIAAVLKEEPRLPEEFERSLPREVQRIAMRCLRKDVERRSQSMAEIKLELDELRDESESGTDRSRMHPAKSVGWKVPMNALAALALVALAGIIGWSIWNRRPEKALSYMLRQITYDDGISRDPALSADGKLIVYASDRSKENNLDLWVQQVSGGRPVRLTKSRADESNPSFSPDGDEVVFNRNNNGVYSVPALGGTERLVASGGYNASYSPDSKWIAYHKGLSGSEDSGLFLAPTDGSPHRKLNTGLAVTYKSVWRPDGRSLIVVGSRAGAVGAGYGWYSVAIENGAATEIDLAQLGRSGQYAEPFGFVHQDQLLFGTGHSGTFSIWQISMPLTTAVSGNPLRITAGSGEFAGPPSHDGRIPYSTYLGNSSVYRIPIDPKTGVSPGEPERVIFGSAESWFPTVTVDGRSLLFVSAREGAAGLWRKDIESGDETPLPTGTHMIRRGLISPDGTQVAVISNEGGKNKTYLLSNGQEFPICDDCRSVLHWTSDGKALLVAAGERDQPILLDLATRKRRLLAEHPKYPLHDFVLSRDRRWLTFRALVSTNEHTVYVSPVHEDRPSVEQEWIPVSGGAPHFRPFWSAEGNLLYFYAAKDGFTCLYAQRLDPVTKQRRGEHFAVRHFHGDLRPVAAVHVGYGFAVDRLYIPLSSDKGNIWLAEPETAH